MTPAEEKVLLSVVSLRRYDLEESVIHCFVAEQDWVRPFIVQPFPLSETASIGNMDGLPVELVGEICRWLDIRSAFKFRQASTLAREIVSGLPEYHAVAEHALQSLRAVLCTGMARHITLTDLFRPLCTSKCVECGAFGAVLFLPTLERCCYPCLINAPRLHVEPLMSMPNNTLPVVYSIPGIYSLQKKFFYGRLHVLAMDNAVKTLQALGLGPPATIRHFRDSKALRCMAATMFPSLNLIAGTSEEGLCCRGCFRAKKDLGDLPLHLRRDQLFTTAGILAHFSVCPEAQKLWSDSRNGAVSVSEFRPPTALEQAGTQTCLAELLRQMQAHAAGL